MNLRLNKHLIADLSLLLVTCIWGATFVTVKNVLDNAPPFTFNGIRFFLAALTMLPFVMTQYKKINREMLFAGVTLGIFLFLGYSFQTAGLKYTTASNAGFITGLSVVMVPIITVFVSRKPLPLNIILGVISATIGLALLTLNANLSFNYGDILEFFCAISFALHVFNVGHFSPKFETGPLVMLQILTVGVLSSIAGFATEKPHLVFDRELIEALVITAVFATTFAFYIQNRMQKFTTATRTAIIFSMEPVFSAFFAWLLLNEGFTARSIIGGLLVLAGMVLSEIKLGTSKA